MVARHGGVKFENITKMTTTYFLMVFIRFKFQEAIKVIGYDSTLLGTVNWF